jgi:uncharacterized protein (TIGR03435 family)
MGTRTQDRERKLNEFFARALKASPAAVHTSEERVLTQLRSEAAKMTTAIGLREAVEDTGFDRTFWRRTPIRAAAVLLFGAVLLLPLLKTFISPPPVYAIVESVDGALYRVTGGKPLSVVAGERIDVGTLVRTESRAKAILKLSDGGRIEMHPESALSLEHEKRGTSIRLDDGFINVKPATQRTASLYVQNREVTAPVTVSAEPEPRFEVASVRLVVPMSDRIGQRGAAPGAEPRTVAAATPTGPRCISPLNVTLDPGRLRITDASLWAIIATAYGNPCPLENDLSGGSMWIQGDLYQIEALIPAGTPAYTRMDFIDGNAPILQRMLQNLLAERFKLRLSREMKEFPAYSLLLVDQAKLKVADPAAPPAPWGAPGPPKFRLSFDKISLTQFANHLSTVLFRHVIDKTGARGLYDIAIIQPMPDNPNDLQETTKTITKGLEEQLGLKLESSRALVELLVIDHAERPSEN